MSQKTALITGASSGIGQATARRLAEEGYDLILLARRQDRLDALRKEMAPLGRRVTTLAIDVRDRASLQGMLGKLPLENVTALINNAGLAKGNAKIQDGDMAHWDEMIDTNVKGLLTLTRFVLPHFIQRKEGHIINMGSVAGLLVYSGAAVYCASKFAVKAISEGLRMDLLGTPIRVTNIEPGMVDTEFSLVRSGDAEKAKAVYQGMTPLKAADIADCIAWALSRPPHVNIQELVIYPTDQASVGQVYRR